MMFPSVQGAPPTPAKASRRVSEYCAPALVRRKSALSIVSQNPTAACRIGFLLAAP
jgi:hypothetical protein